MKQLGLIILVIFLSNCGSNKTAMKEQEQTKEIKFITLAQASLHGNGREGITEGNYVIKDLKSWEDLLNKMNSINSESNKFENKKIDFNKEMVIAVFGRVLGSGGTKISVKKIIETPEHYRVISKYQTSGGLAIMVMNQPYHIVVVPKTDKPVIFELKKS
jgi:hypothetical protein